MEGEQKHQCESLTLKGVRCKNKGKKYCHLHILKIISKCEVEACKKLSFNGKRCEKHKCKENCECEKIEKCKDEYHKIICAICLDDITRKNKKNELLVCGHLFHISCINKWRRKSNTCPLCRRIV